ncbi:hypothetical protein ACJX0J_009066, partial [Zea mays]
ISQDVPPFLPLVLPFLDRVAPQLVDARRPGEGDPNRMCDHPYAWGTIQGNYLRAERGSSHGQAATATQDDRRGSIRGTWLSAPPPSDAEIARWLTKAMEIRKGTDGVIIPYVFPIHNGEGGGLRVGGAIAEGQKDRVEKPRRRAEHQMRSRGTETFSIDEDGDDDDDANAGSELWAIPNASLDASTVDPVPTLPVVPADTPLGPPVLATKAGDGTNALPECHEGEVPFRGQRELNEESDATEKVLRDGLDRLSTMRQSLA